MPLGPDSQENFLPSERPGEFPYTRGIHPRMYQSRLWTMRQVCGFAGAEETNRRFKYLMEQGQTGLSVTFDMPTLMGYDSDDPASASEVGRCGVAVSCLADMETLFRDLPLDKVSVSMTINGPASILWAMYLVAAERQGVAWKDLSGTLQNDILKEYISQNEYIYPPAESMRLVVDTLEFGAKHTPRFNPVSISGYHMREAGSTAVQEVAFTLRNGMEYAAWAIARGLSIDAVAPRFSFFFNSHNDLFEEVAKFRAARRVWARVMRDRFGAKEERSWKLRFHAQTAGSSLTLQQPLTNVVRTSIQALAAVLGGCQSLHTNSFDEAFALPSEQAVALALRTQQVLAHENHVTDVPDPLGGSHYVEQLTAEIERRVYEYIETIDKMGGMVRAVEEGYPQSEIAAASYVTQKAIESGESTVVGVNAFRQESEAAPEGLFALDEDAERRQVERLRELRASRDEAALNRTLDDLRQVARGDGNTMPPLLAAVRAGGTVGELVNALADVFTRYTPSPIL